MKERKGKKIHKEKGREQQTRAHRREGWQGELQGEGREARVTQP